MLLFIHLSSYISRVIGNLQNCTVEVVNAQVTRSRRGEKVVKAAVKLLSRGDVVLIVACGGLKSVSGLFLGV